MTVPHAPSASLSTLHRADGSATYSGNGYSVICGVNGPVEVQRRDELPEEAAVEVSVRPAVGVGGTRERHLESILYATLRHLILVQNHPRTLIQITLQITGAPEYDAAATKALQASSGLSMLPALLQAATLALLSASIPLAMTLTSALVAVSPSGDVIHDPDPRQLEKASSIHVLGFSSHGELLVAESEGTFSLQLWDRVFEDTKPICCGDSLAGGADVTRMDTDDAADLQGFMRGAVRDKVERDQRWKQELSG
ncbi:MAG: hypothetical protein M1819_005806 [Sarea resinae]|nr:MAG: hypothetical protein M1819_005806 [Sarea resinae]